MSSAETDYVMPKKVDIFQHLKLSLKNADINCKCGKGNCYYCIPCKLSVCENCNLASHKKHILVLKDDYVMNDSTIDSAFEPAKESFQKNELFINFQPLKEKYIKNVNDVANSLDALVKKFREKKLKEVEMLFENFEKNKKEINDKIEACKESVKKYSSRNKDFFNPATQSTQQDNGNTIFLLNYDILTLIKRHSIDIAKEANSLNVLVNQFGDNQLITNEKTVKDVEKILFPPDEDEAYNEEVESAMPLLRFISTSNKLAQEDFVDVNDRVARYNTQIDNFRKVVLAAVSKYGNLKEIEKSIASFENTKQKGADNLFSRRKPGTISNKESMSLLPTVHITKKEDVALNNPILNKYFAYLTIDLYGNHFKMESKELQSSHADLLIKVNDDEDADYGKVVEGTNEIVIYDKKNQKMYKKKLNLTKNPYGYTKFPIGCRSLLIGDKLYITGGKDEQTEYPNVLIYDRKQDKLKRIMDLRVPRAYHTMVFNEVFDTIMIIGGEENDTVEIFDPLTNRWQLLPPLLYPRANPFFYFDESKGLMYVMFGSEGSFMKNHYTDIIEYLDLTEIRDGWNRLDYNNKASVNLKSYLNVCPLNNDLMLIYGAITARNSNRTVNVLNLLKKEVTKVDKNLMEALRNEAKKSRRLSSIISSISLTSMNG